MKKARTHLIPTLISGLIVLAGAASGTIAVVQPVSALSLPPTFAYDAGSACKLPEDVAGQETGAYLKDGYTCCPRGYTDASSCLFGKYINPLVQLLSALVGIAVVISIIYGGIQYVTSAGDPQRAEAGKKRIIESLVGLAAFMLLFAFIQYVLPGGILNGH